MLVAVSVKIYCAGNGNRANNNEKNTRVAKEEEVSEGG